MANTVAPARNPKFEKNGEHQPLCGSTTLMARELGETGAVAASVVTAAAKAYVFLFTLPLRMEARRISAVLLVRFRVHSISASPPCVPFARLFPGRRRIDRHDLDDHLAAADDPGVGAGNLLRLATELHPMHQRHVVAA